MFADIKSDIVRVKSEIDEIQQKGKGNNFTKIHFHLTLLYYLTGSVSRLTVSHFESDVAYYCSKYHTGTRQVALRRHSPVARQSAQQPKPPQHMPRLCQPRNGEVCSGCQVVHCVQGGELLGWLLLLPAPPREEEQPENTGAVSVSPVPVKHTWLFRHRRE